MAEHTQSDKDRSILHALGYAQELRRGMSGFSNFAISFTIISVLSGTLTLYATGINYGGPVMEAWGWPLVSFFVLIVGLGMAEIASKYPTAGGLYYWSSKMGGPAWGWFTGWFNLIGQIAITAGIDYGAAIFTTALLNLLWPGTFPATPHTIIYVYAVILALHVLLNVFSVRLVALLNDISVWWHVLGVTIIVGFLIFKPDNHQSVSTVFQPHDQQQRLLARLAVVRAAARPVAGAVHLHGVRRLCAHERGDERRVDRRGPRGRDVDRRLGDLRLHPCSRRDVCDPELHRHDGRRHLRGQAGVPRRARVGRREGDALHHRGGAVLLRHVVDHFGVEDDVRVLPRPCRSGPPALAAPERGARAVPRSCSRSRRSRSCARSPRTSRRTSVWAPDTSRTRR